MAILTNLGTPWQTYEHLTRVSQIPRRERLRSDSSSCKPVLSDYYTPRAGQVFEALEREADRIDYFSMVRRGQVGMVRKRHGDGCFSLLTPPADSPGPPRTDGTPVPKHIAYRSRFVLIAVGYPGMKFLPDLQDYRSEFGDRTHVVNAYESHEHVYETHKQQGGNVVVSGGGIVASRVLRRPIGPLRLVFVRWRYRGGRLTEASPW